MSYLYRPTPVLNAWEPPPPAVVLRGGNMRGYQTNIDWNGFFEAARRARCGTPWIVRSGTMGRFLGQDDSVDTSGVDLSTLPLAPVDLSQLSSLQPTDTGNLNLPPSFFNMAPPIAPAIVPYNPGAPPVITSGGGTVSAPSVSTSAPSASGLTSLISAITGGVSAVAKAATGQINPAIAPAMPPIPAGMTQAQLLAQAQSLQAQAAAVAATNPSLAATYTTEANQYLAAAGVAGSGTSLLTQSTIIAGMPNWEVFALGLGFLAVVGVLIKFGTKK